jgi:hypothetical protein
MADVQDKLIHRVPIEQRKGKPRPYRPSSPWLEAGSAGGGGAHFWGVDAEAQVGEVGLA